VVVAIYLAGKLAYRMRDVLLMILVAGFVAVILNPMVSSVQRRVHRRGWAVTIVIGWATLVFIGLAVLFGHPLVNGVTHLSARLPSYVQDAADGHGWVGQLVRHFHLQQWVAQNAPKLQTLGTSLAKPALNFGKGAASVLGTLVDFLPMIGGALAGIPTVLFATAHSLTDGIVMAAVFVGYQQLENHVLNPVIMGRTVKINPLLVLLAVLFGTSLGDWAGGIFGAFVAALLSIPCAAALQVIVREIWRATA
jgi:predicted PurR-regulated permease PerM